MNKVPFAPRCASERTLTDLSVPSQDNMVKSNIDKKFSAHYDAVEAELKSSTVGKVLLLVCVT